MIPAVQCSGSVQRCRYVFSIGIFNQRVNVDADDVLVTMLNIHGGWGGVGCVGVGCGEGLAGHSESRYRPKTGASRLCELGE